MNRNICEIWALRMSLNTYDHLFSPTLNIIYDLIPHHILTNFKKKVSEATDGSKMPKLWLHCMRVEVEERYLRTGLRIGLEFDQLLTTSHKFMCFNSMLVFVSTSTVQARQFSRGDYRNGNSRIAGLSPTWDWLYISNLKALKIVTNDKLLSSLTANVYHKFLECFKWFFCVIF